MREAWMDHGEAVEVVVAELEARIRELETALVESNKNTLTPKQQGDIATRTLTAPWREWTAEVSPASKGKEAE